jgi:hypothetical protein
MSQFDTSVFTNWAKETTPKYTERSLNLRMVMAEFVGEFRHYIAILSFYKFACQGAESAGRPVSSFCLCIRKATDVLTNFR